MSLTWWSTIARKDFAYDLHPACNIEDKLQLHLQNESKEKHTQYHKRGINKRVAMIKFLNFIIEN
jgi:hypothetical protein